MGDGGLDFLTFAVFGGGALIAFVVALKAGLLSNVEDAKYHILSIDEPDYYSGQEQIADYTQRGFWHAAVRCGGDYGSNRKYA